jgi:hypothetical protein
MLRGHMPQHLDPQPSLRRADSTIGFGALARMPRTPPITPYGFIGFGSMDATKPCEFIGFGAMDAAKPYEFIGFGAMDATKPCEFIGFGAMGATKPSVSEPSHSSFLFSHAGTYTSDADAESTPRNDN